MIFFCACKNNLEKNVAIEVWAYEVETENGKLNGWRGNVEKKMNRNRRLCGRKLKVGAKVRSFFFFLKK